MDEQLERFKEFMLQQQAQSVVRVAQMEDLLVQFAQAARERFAANERRAQEWDEKFAALLDAQIRSEDKAAKTDREIKERAAEFDRAAKERAAEFDMKLAALIDAQMRTEETVKRLGDRIDRLTLLVEQHTADGHGGRARPES